MDNIDLTKSFKNGTIKYDLATIPEKLNDWTFEALMEGARLIAGLWQVYIRVDTGSARDSIRVERGGIGKNWREVKVRGGGYVVNPKTGRLVDYMAIIEEKYGAGQQAFEEGAPQIAAMINEGLLEATRSV